MSEILVGIQATEAAIALLGQVINLAQTLSAKTDVTDEVLAAHKKALDDAITAAQAIIDAAKDKA